MQASAVDKRTLDVLNSLPDAVLGISETGKIAFLNESASIMLGYKADEIAGRHLQDFFIEINDDFFSKEVLPVLNSNPKVRRCSLTFKATTHAGSKADVLLTTSKLAGASALLSFRNFITPGVDNELKYQNEALQKQLEVKEEEINLANQEIEAFKFSLEHDLKSPLRIISGYTKIIEKKYENLLNDEALDLLESIQKYSLRLNNLMSELVSFSKLGKSELIISTLDMTSIAQIAINELNADIKSSVEINLQPLKPASGDPFMMVKVFYQLLSNAVKYSSKTINPSVEIFSFEDKGNIVYAVSDNGIGFDMKYEKMIYSLFYRLHDLTEYEGMGVGLAVVQRIIGRHGGRLWAKSEPGKGTTFYFSLPHKH